MAHTQKRTRGRPRVEGRAISTASPRYKYRTSPPCNDSARTAPRHESARTAPRRSHAANRRVREDAIRWKHNLMCAHKGVRARTHAPAPRAHAHQCTHSNPYTSIDAATHSRSHAVAHAHRPAYTQTLTHKHMLQTHTDACTHTHTRSHTGASSRTRTHTHTPRGGMLEMREEPIPRLVPRARSPEYPFECLSIVSGGQKGSRDTQPNSTELALSAP